MGKISLMVNRERLGNRNALTRCKLDFFFESNWRFAESTEKLGWNEKEDSIKHREIHQCWKGTKRVQTISLGVLLQSKGEETVHGRTAIVKKNNNRNVQKVLGMVLELLPQFSLFSYKG